ncbi:MAG: ROK family protein [Pirellulales bacterium]|nr:ROK family protein [Pirellulales bacterium]
MKSNNGKDSKRLYVGVDIGGTKIQGSLVRESGEILCREKQATPREGGPEVVLAIIEKVIDGALKKGGVDVGDLSAVGIAVPGVVDPDRGFVVVAPNMRLTGVALGAHLEARYKIPIVLGNDGNLGALGEAWLGSARKSKSALYICVGTGIGSGLVLKGKLWRGDRESAGEIGHMIMQPGGPRCGCGNHGCLEALASRTAIERDLRQQVVAGRTSVITELTGGNLDVIRSGMIRKALEVQDELVTEVVRRASEFLGYACLNVRHLIDPEVLVLGGGVIMACSDYIMPIIENIVGQDPLAGARDGGKILVSALGDDAVVLGAVAAARRLVGRNPFKKRFRIQPKYPQITRYRFGEITVARKSYTHDVYIPVSGKVKKRRVPQDAEAAGSKHVVGAAELEKVCKGGPEVLFVAAGKSGLVELTDEARRYLAHRSIRLEIHPAAKAIEGYNKSKQRKALLAHLTC